LAGARSDALNKVVRGEDLNKVVKGEDLNKVVIGEGNLEGGRR
jgi:hypothetical protein